jgi:hypothetical protein
MELEGKVYGGDAEEGERGSPSVRWVSGSGPLGCFVLLRGSFGPLAPVVPMHDQQWGTTGDRCVSPAYPDPGVCLVP